MNLWPFVRLQRTGHRTFYWSGLNVLTTIVKKHHTHLILWIHIMVLILLALIFYIGLTLLFRSNNSSLLSIHELLKMCLKYERLKGLSSGFISVKQDIYIMPVDHTYMRTRLKVHSFPKVYITQNKRSHRTSKYKQVQWCPLSPYWISTLPLNTSKDSRSIQ